MRILFAQLPGVDFDELVRLDRLGLTTVEQIRAFDADALAFWAQIQPAVVQRWRDLAALLRWSMPAPANARWLAQLGITSIRMLAEMPAVDLLATVRRGMALPGAPFDPADVRLWRRAAQHLCGCPQDSLDIEAMFQQTSLRIETSGTPSPA